MRRLICRLLILLTSVPAIAGDLEERFLENQKSLESLQADFRQIITSPGLKQPVVSEGRFYYLAPDKLRIDYTKPEGDYFLLNGDHFESRRRGKAPVVVPVNHPSARALSSLREVLRGTPPSEDFQKQVDRKEGEIRVVLTPSTASPAMPQKIENRVDANSLALLGMTITTPNGAGMEFLLENPRRNQAIDPAVFSSGK